MRRFSLVVLLTITACVAPITPPPTTRPSTTFSTFPALTTTTTTLPRLAMTVEDCETPPVTFAVLCEVVETLEAYHVQPPDPATLAAAAVVGVKSYQGGEGSVPVANLTCAVPDPAFEIFCGSIAERLAEEALSVDRLVESAIQTMLALSVDPFTLYLPPRLVDAINDDGVVGNLGILIAAKDAGGTSCARIGGPCPLRVVSVLPESPAEAAGMAAGDVIVSVDGEEVEGLNLVEAAASLAGEAGTTAIIEIDRGGSTLTLSVDRGTVDTVAVSSEMVGATGYLRLLEFSFEAPYDFHNQLESLLEAGATTLVLDLRDNPGGLLTSVVLIGSEFFSDGLVMKSSSPTESLDFPVVEGGIATGGVRIVTLVNEGSASAAEVLAAVLQERGRSLVVGKASYGKNTIQVPFELRNDGILRVTIARWTTPSGASVALQGVQPDVVVPIPSELEPAEVVELALGAAGP